MCGGCGRVGGARQRPLLPGRLRCRGAGRVGGWRASFRVRWLFRRFRSGPQSGSLGRVSSPPLIKPDVRISRIRLSDEIMPSRSEGPLSSASGSRGRNLSAASRPGSARSPRTSPCASDRATGVAAGPHGDLPRLSRADMAEAEVVRPSDDSSVQAFHHDLGRQRPVAWRRCLNHPLRLLPAGATVAGRDSHPRRIGALPRHTVAIVLTHCLSISRLQDCCNDFSGVGK